jgi:hypothetical protein
MESAFMARKDERSTRLRQASALQGAQYSTPNAEFSKEILYETSQLRKANHQIQPIGRN